MKSIDVVIEISKGSNIKYEFDKEKGKLRLDRILYGSHVYPANYGFIEKTLELDGDPVDVMVLMSQPILPGCIVKVKIIGGLEMIDEGEIDNKIIGICSSDFEWNHFENLEAIPEKIKAKIYDFLQNYKKLEKKKVVLKNWFNKRKAEQIIEEAKKRFCKN